MIQEHNWLYETSIRGYRCMRFGALPAANQRRMTDCEGCGAIVPDIEMETLMDWTELTQDTPQRLDGIWHYRLRPMAALVGLVEEACR